MADPVATRSSCVDASSGRARTRGSTSFAALRTPRAAALGAKHGEAQRLVVAYESDYRRHVDEPSRPPTLELTAATAAFIDACQQFVGVIGPRPATA